MAAYPHGVGFGDVAPQSVFLGGEAESAVTQVTWSSWGSKQSVGVGTGCYYSGAQAAANCKHEQATLIAFDLGTCAGIFMYQRLEYVFAEEGQVFDPSRGMDICTGA